MDIQAKELQVILFNGDTVGIQTEDGYCLFTARVAVEIAQSLISTALEADPDLNVSAIMEAYRVAHKDKRQHLDS